MPATDLLGERDAWHLLRRAGFGAHASEVAEFAGLTRAEAVDALLAVKPSAVRPSVAPTAGLEAVAGMQAWWLRRMASPRYRLQEKMVLFWHDHFPSGFAVINRLDGLAEQNALFRLHGLGSFRALVHQLTRNRAMLEYLDGRRNRVGAVNENYARELMELFTIGPTDDLGWLNYQQGDVKTLARALTGFHYVDVEVKKPTVYLAQTRFDASNKVLFFGRPFQHHGILGVEDPNGVPFPPGTNVLDAMFAHRDALGRLTLARFLVRKLWAWFATPSCEDELVTELADAFVASGYVLGELVRRMLTHDAFYAEEARSSTPKTPPEFAIQAILALRVKVSWLELPRPLGQMGMALFDPPGVEGWQHGSAWLASSRYLARMALAQAIASGRGKNGFTFRPSVPAGATPTSLVDAALAQLGLEVSPDTRQRLIDYLSGGTFGSESWYEMKLRGLYALLLSLPEFQVH